MERDVRRTSAPIRSSRWLATGISDSGGSSRYRDLEHGSRWNVQCPPSRGGDPSGWPVPARNHLRRRRLASRRWPTTATPTGRPHGGIWPDPASSSRVVGARGGSALSARSKMGIEHDVGDCIRFLHRGWSRRGGSPRLAARSAYRGVRLSGADRVGDSARGAAVCAHSAGARRERGPAKRAARTS